MYCQDGGLYAAGAPRTFSQAPYALPDSAYLATRTPDSRGTCASINFGGGGTGAHTEPSLDRWCNPFSLHCWLNSCKLVVDFSRHDCALTCQAFS